MAVGWGPDDRTAPGASVVARGSSEGEPESGVVVGQRHAHDLYDLEIDGPAAVGDEACDARALGVRRLRHFDVEELAES